MARELGWSSSRKREEYERAVKFLGNMGLRFVDEKNENVNGGRGLLGWIEKLLGRELGLSTPLVRTRITTLYSRAQFEPRELESLRTVFNNAQDGTSSSSSAASAVTVVEGQTPKSLLLSKSQLAGLLSQVRGYEQTKVQHIESAFLQLGLGNGVSAIGWNEFLEVRHCHSRAFFCLVYRCCFSSIPGLCSSQRAFR